jgi:hypothetical protein
MPNEPTLAEQLREFLNAKLGDDWRRHVSLTVRADNLYWLVFLAERGIEERRATFKAQGVGATEAAAPAASRFDGAPAVPAYLLIRGVHAGGATEVGRGN